MSRQVRATPEADAQIGAIDDWWRWNRLAAPDLFLDELAASFEVIGYSPQIGRRYRQSPVSGTRRVLLDENLPHDLAAALTGHPVSTVQGLGWAGTKNGALLKRAGEECDVFVTMDTNIERQQRLASLPFGVVIIRAASNRMKDLLPSRAR